MGRFRELRYWSGAHQCDCLRLSHIGEDQKERWVILELNIGPTERDKREKVAEQSLVAAENRGDPPGEIPLYFD